MSTMVIDEFYEYEIEAIKEGGMGRVLILRRLGESPFGGGLYREHLAAKTFKDSEFVAQNGELFHRELSIWLHLDAPNVAELLKIVFVEGQLYALMPVYDGSLRDMLLGGQTIDLPHIQAVILSATECLAAAFKKGRVLHLDVKPENVLVRCNAQGPPAFHISDWGIAGLQQSGGAAHQRDYLAPPSFLSTMSGMGTVPYMSPERLGGQHADFRADIYSLGMIMFEMLVGCLPFDLRGGEPLDGQILSGRYYEIAGAVLAKLPERAVSKTILSAIHPNREERFVSYSRFARHVATF